MMKNGKNLALTVMICSLSSACSSTSIVNEQPVLPEVPEYVKVPHPINFELSSLKAIFYHQLAPQEVQGSFSEKCDEDFQKLAQVSSSREERAKAATELVTIDPEKMHWCFYSKISALQDQLQSDTTWSQRQKNVFETFEFIAPIANAFQESFHDSRYLRWAGQYYSKISEWVFFRKVQPLPDSTLSLVSGVNSTNLEPWVEVGKKQTQDDSVFKKYGINLTTTTVRLPASGEENPVITADEPFDQK